MAGQEDTSRHSEGLTRPLRAPEGGAELDGGDAEKGETGGT